MNEKLLYKGRPVEELSREELIEALRWLHHIYLNALNLHRRDLENLLVVERDLNR